jgi:hypothetical protein
VLLDSPVRKIAFSHDGQRIITGTRDGRLHVWDPELGRVSDLPPQGTAVTSIAISPDGNLFATGTEGGTVRLWDTTSLRQTGQTYKHNGAARGLAFRPDSQALAIGQDDGTIRLWGVPRSTAIGHSLRSDSPVHNVTFRTGKAWRPARRTGSFVVGRCPCRQSRAARIRSAVGSRGRRASSSTTKAQDSRRTPWPINRSIRNRGPGRYQSDTVGEFPAGQGAVQIGARKSP